MKEKTIFKKTEFKISITILILLVLVLVCVFIYDSIKGKKKNNEIEKVISEFHQNMENENNTEIEGKTIIGTIKINKTLVEYPIITYENLNSLNIAICKYIGPEINTIGNLCLLGHNMRSGMFFSNLYKLENGDTVELINTNGNTVEYIVYDKFYITPIEGEVLDQTNKNYKELTLITCNDISTKRLVIKLKENI